MRERRCIATGETKSAEELIRFVCGPDGMAVPDLAGKLPGRGCWVSAQPEAIQKACDKGLFKRHIDAKALGADELLSQLVKLFGTRLRQTLALARRAGLAIGGGGKLASYDFMDGLLIAADASQREAKAHKNRLQPEWGYEGFDGHFLGQPFGRESLAYVGILPDERHPTKGLNMKIRQDITRFQAFLVPLGCQEGPVRCITSHHKVIEKTN